MRSCKSYTLFLTALFIVTLAVSAWSQTATVTISSYPSSVNEGQPFDVVVDYTADLYDYGLAARIFLEVVDADTGEILETLWDDADGQCYEGPSGQVTFTASVSGVSAIYFNAYISPVEFNSWFVTELESYPRDGSYPYQWTGNGVTHDIFYQGSLILADNVEGNYCYCSGITYQVFMDAYEDYNASWGYNDIYGMTVDDMVDFRQEWYGWYSTKCAIAALTKYNVAYEISYQDKEKLLPGDDVQLWRWSGSGHSVIFIDWVRDAQQNITGITYWSTQSSTNGIDYNTEYFGQGSSYLKDDECYYARKVKPVDDDDWPNRYSDDNTAGNPTTVGTGTPTPTPTPTPSPTPGAKVYVHDIEMTGAQAGKGPNYFATATVWIKNDSGEDVEEATVSGEWSGAVSETVSGDTGPDGKVSLRSSKKKNGGTFTFCVTDVVASSYTYDPTLNNESCDSITVP